MQDSANVLLSFLPTTKLEWKLENDKRKEILKKHIKGICPSLRLRILLFCCVRRKVELSVPASDVSLSIPSDSDWAPTVYWAPWLVIYIQDFTSSWKQLSYVDISLIKSIFQRGKVKLIHGGQTFGVSIWTQGNWLQSSVLTTMPSQLCAYFS